MRVDRLRGRVAARRHQKVVEEAPAALGRALALAEPEDYVRTFIDEGEPMADLANRTLFISGASRGIGEAIAHGLAAYGATVIASSRDREAVERVAAEMLEGLPEGQIRAKVPKKLKPPVGETFEDAACGDGPIDAALKTIDRISDALPSEMREQTKSFLAQSLNAVVTQVLVKTPDGRGRKAVLEILVNTKAISNLIMSDQTHLIPSQLQTGKEVGMQLMDQALLEAIEAKAGFRVVERRSDEPDRQEAIGTTTVEVLGPGDRVEEIAGHLEEVPPADGRHLRRPVGRRVGGRRCLPHPRRRRELAGRGRGPARPAHQRGGGRPRAAAGGVRGQRPRRLRLARSRRELAGLQPGPAGRRDGHGPDHLRRRG